MPAGSHLSARTTYPSTMPQLTALIYNYRDKLKTYHKIKAKMFHYGRAQWGKVRLSQPIVPASQRSGPITADRADVFTYVGSFKWQFLGQRQPEPPLDLELFYNKHGRQGAPSGWFFTGGNYYSWFQIPETIVHIQDKREQAILHNQQILELQGRVQEAQVLKEAQDEQPPSMKNMNYDRASSSTTNKSWALKRAQDMWKSIGEEQEQAAAKRMKGMVAKSDKDEEQAAAKRMKYQTTMGGA